MVDAFWDSVSAELIQRIVNVSTSNFSYPTTVPLPLDFRYYHLTYTVLRSPTILLPLFPSFSIVSHKNWAKFGSVCS